MPPYKRFLVGRPFTKDPPITKNFEVGVGYFRNFLNHQPMWLFSMVLFGGCIAGASIGMVYEKFTVDPDYKLEYNSEYKVKRSADVKDPNKDCYN